MPPMMQPLGTKIPRSRHFYFSRRWSRRRYRAYHARFDNKSRVAEPGHFDIRWRRGVSAWRCRGDIRPSASAGPTKAGHDMSRRAAERAAMPRFRVPRCFPRDVSLLLSAKFTHAQAASGHKHYCARCRAPPRRCRPRLIILLLPGLPPFTLRKLVAAWSAPGLELLYFRHFS